VKKSRGYFGKIHRDPEGERLTPNMDAKSNGLLTLADDPEPINLGAFAHHFMRRK
jgi:hypothetical protein